MKKKIIIVFVFCLIVFFIFYYKNYRNGNNISNIKKDKIIEYILNSKLEYTADIEVKVISNKKENIYKMKQELKDKKTRQEVLEPSNIRGLIIENENNKLKIQNTNLNLEKIYNDYSMILNNSLFLNVFIEDYKNNISKEYRNNGEIVLETKLNNSSNTYIKYKKLFINEKNMKPTKLEIEDNTKKTRISIIYNNIEIK